MKNTLAIIVLSMCCANSAFSEEFEFIFSNYMMTNCLLIEKVDKLRQGRTIELSEANIELLEKSAFKDECAVVTTNGQLKVDTLKPIPYVKIKGDRYEISYSKYCEGLRTSLMVTDRGDYYSCLGSYRFNSLFKRQAFEPFPELEGGKPLIVIGASREGGMIDKKRWYIANYGLTRGADGVAKSFAITLIRIKEQQRVRES